MRKSKIDGKFPTQSSLLETTSRGLKPRISRLRVPRIGEMESLKVPNWWPSLRPRLCLSRPSDLETGMRPRPSQGGLAMAELPLEGVGSCTAWRCPGGTLFVACVPGLLCSPACRVGPAELEADPDEAGA